MTQQISSELPEIEPREGSENSVAAEDASSVLPGEAVYTERRANQALEQGRVTTGAQATMIQQQILAQSTTPSQQAQQVTSDNSSGTPQIADDADLIEKEWVLKAKEIVERTKHDPFQQNKGVEHLKADYMQKRYNKEIKLAED